MKNQDRMPSQSVLATCTSGQLKVAGQTIGTTSQGNGSYIVTKTNGGSVIAIPAPCSRTGGVPNTNTSNNTSNSDNNQGE